MIINKIYVRVDNKDYSGLYWLSKSKGQSYINISYEGLRRTLLCTKGAIDQQAKTMLSNLLKSI